MADSTTASAAATQDAKKVSAGFYDRKFQASGWVLGGVGAVIWATNKGRKGRFWWFIGGSMIGSVLGYLADSASKK